MKVIIIALVSISLISCANQQLIKYYEDGSKAIAACEERIAKKELKTKTQEYDCMKLGKAAILRSQEIPENLIANHLALMGVVAEKQDKKKISQKEADYILTKDLSEIQTATAAQQQIQAQQRLAIFNSLQQQQQSQRNANQQLLNQQMMSRPVNCYSNAFGSNLQTTCY